ncbi:HNH endonuclease [Budvicia aquatica]|uniref:Uncharacterized protein n=1 Tax=Budvicia aquatica TaxID=82979 RepID=A0A484ZW62_9GAMM|nr:HNH endonuclease [Budvicia aquatica]VFS51563.1 Uncharacterised protein [Budvicia aquatica]
MNWVDPLGLKGMPGSETKPTGDRSPEPKVRLPRTNGHWEGEPGNGNWYSDLPEVNEVTGGEPIPFKNGRPDFSKWSFSDIEFEPGLLDGSNRDFSAVYVKVKDAMSLPTNNSARNYLRSKGITPHHLSDTVIQLLPTKLHGKIPHIGSASDMRNGG